MNPLSENAALELKREYTEQALKTVSAYANYGPGTILFGVSDDGSAVGIEDVQRSDCE